MGMLRPHLAPGVSAPILKDHTVSVARLWFLGERIFETHKSMDGCSTMRKTGDSPMESLRLQVVRSGGHTAVIHFP
jgi:hypothetical protein